MKPIRSLLLLIAFASTGAHAEPFITVTTRNLDVLLDGSAKIANALELGKGDEFKEKFLDESGNPDLIGVDKKRAWHFAAFRPADGSSIHRIWQATYVPVTDFKEFRGALQEGKQFTGARNLNIIRKSGGYAVVITRYNKETRLDAEDRKRILQWAKSAPTDPKHDFTGNFVMDEQSRRMAILGVTFAKSMVGQQLAPEAIRKNSQAPTPPPGAVDMLNVYFDLGLMIVKGADKITLNLDVKDDVLILRDRVTALPDSQLSKLLRPARSDIGLLTQYIAADTPLAFVGHMTGDSYLRKLLTRAMTASNKMTGTELDDGIVKQTEKLMDAMLPMSFAVAIDWGERIGATGIYQFADANAPAIHDQLMAFTEEYMKQQAGEGGVYSQFEAKRSVPTVDGMGIDRLTLKLNRDNPIFSKQDRKTISRIWPDNELRFEYASKGRRFFYSMGLPVERAATPAKNPADLAVNADHNTVLLGRINPISIIHRSLAMRRKRSKYTQRMLVILDPEGAGVDVRVNLDGGIDGIASVPLKMLRELGKMLNSGSSE